MTAQLLERAENSAEATPAMQIKERQIVALHLGSETYGLDIAAIHTVITPQAITPVPKTPDFIAGVMNLRGRILPVIDLRQRFGLPPLPEEGRKGTRIVIVDVDGLTAGLIVDSVSEVLNLPAENITPPSQLVTSVETECIIGIGRVASGASKEAPSAAARSKTNASSKDKAAPKERLIILLDAYKTLTTGPQDADVLQKLQKAA